MATKQEKNQKWAEKQLLKILPFDQWLAARPRTDFEIELYKESFKTLLDLAEGKTEFYNTISIVNRNGKRVVSKK